MLNALVSQITGARSDVSAQLLGTQFTKVELEGLKADLEQLRRTFTFKGLERIAALLAQTKKITTQAWSEKDKQNLKELIEKLKKAAERFGVRLEMDNTRVGNPLIRVYNRINNQQLTTIPLQLLLRMLVSVHTPSGNQKGTTLGQDFSPELIDNSAQDLADAIVSSAKANIVV